MASLRCTNQLRPAAAALLWLLGCFVACHTASAQTPADEGLTIDWPAQSQASKPWTRWWWHGSAVDNENLTRLLQEYNRVGLGGVEITCIYGVQGEEQRELRYRSHAWIAAVRHAIAEANRIGMGVDLPAGSGWRLGGPNLPRELGNTRLVLDTQSVTGPHAVVIDFEDVTPQAAAAFGAEGQSIDLSDRFRDGALRWDAPPGEWTVVTAAHRLWGDRVKRAGPGGEGLNINPFWDASVDGYLSDFSSTASQLPGVRAQFHDSFEYEGNWSPVFFDEFAKRRGYRLEEELLALAGEGRPERVARVKADYREALADLVLEAFIEPWVDWSHQHGALARNQSHGSPANWLDLYAACDIPETETFGPLASGDADPLVLKFASSAANVAGRRLVSCETATWLGEHFNVSLREVREMIDRQMLAGVNHVFYHGTAYSPADAAWPGWLFYASTQLNPQNPVWRDLPALNQYVTHCQSLLQASRPDNDVLLYWPLHDVWHNRSGLRQEVRVHNAGEWLEGQPFHDAADRLREEGYAFDYVSDRLLQRCEAAGGKIVAPGGTYAAVLVPHAEHVPLETFERLAELAASGCRVVFWRGLPESLPGLAGDESEPRWKPDRERFAAAFDALQVRAQVGPELVELLDDASIRRESWSRAVPLEWLRRTNDQGTLYLLCNAGEESFDGAIRVSVAGRDAALFDPATGSIGRAEAVGDGEYRIQLDPKQTVFLLITSQDILAADWVYREDAADPVFLSGEWEVEFIAGGPDLPNGYSTGAGPAPWTDRGTAATDGFAGTARYRTRFDAPDGTAPAWLELGAVHGSARVRVNGEEVGVLLGPAYGLRVGSLKPMGNVLEIEVTGLAANRIRELDRRGVEWRVFKDINFVNRSYRRFDASGWPVRHQGLAGPVTLTPQAAVGTP